MAYVSLWANKHQCGTCEFWTGDRRPHDDRRVASVERFSGECIGSGPYRNRKADGTTSPGRNCWVCWRALSER